MPERERIVELVDRLSRIAHTLQFSGGLNPAQWEALRFVARANHRTCSPGALSEFMGTTKGTVSQTIKALEAKGLVRRGRVAGDGRAVRISITDAGSALLGKDPLGAIHDALTTCSPEDRLQLVDGMERLVGAVQRSVGVAEFGPCTECEHYRPERCSETNSLGCRCAVSGELFSALEIDKICADFSRDSSRRAS
jgi:DNA-binding MarR family transcriptional regulator